MLFWEPEGSSPRPQDSVTGPHPEFRKIQSTRTHPFSVLLFFLGSVQVPRYC
jgi:hypothetical protein